MTGDIHASMVQPRGRAYRDAQVVGHSHYHDPIDRSPGRVAGHSRVWGDASAWAQSRVIDALVESSREAGLNARQTAHVLAIARVESGFNPDAAAGTTSASGLGQFVDRTGHHYGLHRGNRFDLAAQADALVAHYIDNLKLARSRGQGEEHVYKYHHDGPARDYGGLAIARAQVTPYMDRYEAFVRQRLGLAPHQPDPGRGIDPGAPHAAASGAGPLADGTLRRNERGQPVRELQQQLNALGYTFEDAHGRPLAPTGFYGAQTADAVRGFQAGAGLPRTGIADDATRRAIGDASARQHGHGHADGAAPGARAGDGPGSFEQAMRTMLPPRSGVDPHITSDFGHRVINGHDDHHGGVDFNYRGGQNGVNLQHPVVRSPVGGEVVYSGGQYGTVKIRDDRGNLHEILHLDSRSVRATDPPQRVAAGDVIGTMGGRGPGGGNQYAQHVHYQVRDPRGNTIDPERFWDDPPARDRDTPHAHEAPRAESRPPSLARAAFANAAFDIGDRGVGVEALQRQLDAAGYLGRDGLPIAPDARFGPDTQFAVTQVQARHGLPATGAADMETLRALGAELAPRREGEPLAAHRKADAAPPQAVTPAPTAMAAGRAHEAAAAGAAPIAPEASTAAAVTDPAHPDHAMYRDMLGKVSVEARKTGHGIDVTGERIAADLTREARACGLDRVGFVAFSPDGLRAFMTDTQDPAAPSARTATAHINLSATSFPEAGSGSPARVEAAHPPVAPPAPGHAQADPGRDTPPPPRMPL